MFPQKAEKKLAHSKN